MKMKKFLILIVFIALGISSCEKDPEPVTDPNLQEAHCITLAQTFLPMYDDYKEYLDEYDELVERGIREGTFEDKLDYIMNDPEGRFRSCDDFAKANEHLCPDLKGWARGYMNEYR